MKKIALILLLLTLISLSAALTLDECIAKSLRHSGALRQAEIDLQQSDLQHQNSKYLFLPEFTLSSQAELYKPDQQALRHALNLSQQISLFDERFSNLKNTKLEKELSTITLQQRKNDLVVSIVQLYSDLLVSKKTLATHQNSLQTYEKQQRFISEMIKSGTKTELDLYSAQIERQNALLLIKQTEREIAAQINSLEFYTGYRAEINELTEFTLPLNQAISADSIENNADYLISQLKVTTAEVNQKKMRRDLLPKFSLQGSYQWLDSRIINDGSQTFDSYGNLLELDSANSDWKISALVSYPLGSLLASRNSLASARFQTKKQKIALDDTSQELSNLLREYKLDFSLKQAEWEIYQEMNDFATQKFRLAQARYQSGLLDFLEFKNAEKEKSQSEIDLIKAQYAAIISYIQLQKISGEKILGKYYSSCS
ncbi:MAG: TolC family protein [Candidatus Cloacimonadales bacterium]